MCHQILTLLSCAGGILISSGAFKTELEYFGNRTLAWQLIFVPSLCVGVIQVVMIGFTLNLYCYHRWLKKHGITTLEHIFKFNSSKNLSKITPKPRPQIAPEVSKSQRETERVKIRTKQAEMSSSRELSSKNEVVENHLKEGEFRSQQSAISEGFSLGKPKSNLKMAQEYIKNSKLKLGPKNGSLKDFPTNSKREVEPEVFKKQSIDQEHDTVPKSMAKSPLDPPVDGKPDHQKENISIRKMAKRKLAPLELL